MSSPRSSRRDRAAVNPVNVTTARPKCAVILAAGLGTRLEHRTNSLPKCLVEVQGVPILLNALVQLASWHVAETVLVVGYLEDVIRQRIGSRIGRMRIRYRTNPDYRTTSTAQSLWIGLNGIDEDVLVLEGDVFFERGVLNAFRSAPHADATLVEPWNPSLDGSVVQVSAEGKVRAWIHKKDRPAGFALEGTYKTVNLHRFSRAFVRDRLRPVLEDEVARGGREPIETALARIVADGGRVQAVVVNGRWVEIDDEHDLRAAEEMFEGAADGSR